MSKQDNNFWGKVYTFDIGLESSMLHFDVKVLANDVKIIYLCELILSSPTISMNSETTAVFQNYDTSESKLRREFEMYGKIKKVILVTSEKAMGTVLP